MVLRQALKKTTVVAAIASAAFVLFCISATTFISGVQGCDHHHGHGHAQHHEDEGEVIVVEQEGRSLRVRTPNTTVGPPKGVTVKGQQQQFLKNKKGGGRGRGSIQRCGTREPTTKEVRMIQANLAEYGKKRRELRQRQMKEQQQQQENDSNNNDRDLQEEEDETIQMDVYFHIITDSAGNGDVTDEQVQTQIQIMNDVFSGTNAMSPSCDGSTRKERGIKAPFQFNLKEIQRVANDAWYGTSPFDESEMRTTLHKGNCTTLNLYSRRYDETGIGPLLGWSSFPWEGCPSDGTTDAYKFQGISLNVDTLPGVAPDLIAPFDQGITLPHEMGHFLGLFHTFQTTGVFGSCYGIGDGIADTTPGIVSSSGCNKLLDTCPGVSGYDAVQNVMNYSDDCCMETFTPMQIEEMISAYYKYLKGEPLPDDPPIVVGEGDFPVITFP